MHSQWHNTKCPICGHGILTDGLTESSVDYKGYTYTFKSKGAFCSFCKDGITIHDPDEEQQWISFRERIDSNTKI